MLEILIDKVVPGVARLVLYITAGILLGWVLEVLGITRRLAVVARPVMRVARLPPLCATAFMTAFVSPKAAAGMLSAAFANQEIDRKALILGATANSVPSALMHLKVAAPLLITVLGLAGLGYVGFIVGSSLLLLVITMVLGQLHRSETHTEHGDSPSAAATIKQPRITDWRVAWQRWRQLLPKVLLIAVPLYSLVAYLNATGAFKKMGALLPPGLESILPPSAMAILVAGMSGASRAAPVAREFLDSGELTSTAVFFTLLTGYVLSLPIRVMRRNLPSALSLYPGRNGLYIILLSQGVRWLLAATLVLGWITTQWKAAA